jgi:chemotaxis protein methyltransferase CheR
VQPNDFEFFARVLKDRSGLVLTKDKGYLLENKLLPLVRQKKLRGVAELTTLLRNGDAALAEGVVEAMMAKDTGSFRDWKPFEHFRSTVLPNLLSARRLKKTFRILCAGVSAGQEAYSLAIILHEHAAALKDWDIEILGIDISPAAIATAETGLYSQFEVQRGLPVRKLLTYFVKTDDSWRINADARACVSFKVWNLLDELFPLGRFDVVLCRNVTAYFDLATKINVLQKLSRITSDDGILYVGAKEPLTGLSASYSEVDSKIGVYTIHRPDLGKIKSLADVDKA